MALCTGRQAPRQQLTCVRSSKSVAALLSRLMSASRSQRWLVPPPAPGPRFFSTARVCCSAAIIAESREREACARFGEGVGAASGGAGKGAGGCWFGTCRGGR
jgi:hypothetical protein